MTCVQVHCIYFWEILNVNVFTKVHVWFRIHVHVGVYVGVAIEHMKRTASGEVLSGNFKIRLSEVITEGLLDLANG